MRDVFEQDVQDVPAQLCFFQRAEIAVQSCGKVFRIWRFRRIVEQHPDEPWPVNLSFYSIFPGAGFKFSRNLREQTVCLIELRLPPLQTVWPAKLIDYENSIGRKQRADMVL